MAASVDSFAAALGAGRGTGTGPEPPGAPAREERFRLDVGTGNLRAYITENLGIPAEEICIDRLCRAFCEPPVAGSWSHGIVVLADCADETGKLIYDGEHGPRLELRVIATEGAELGLQVQLTHVRLPSCLAVSGLIRDAEDFGSPLATDTDSLLAFLQGICDEANRLLPALRTLVAAHGHPAEALPGF